jgi:hypothetical protein
MTRQEIGVRVSAGSRDFAYLDSRPLDDALDDFNRQSHVLWYDRSMSPGYLPRQRIASGRSLDELVSDARGQRRHFQSD